MSIREVAGVIEEIELTERERMIAERGPQGGQRPPGLPPRRGPRLPVAVTRHVGHAVGRRGPAHPAGQPDRLRPGRRALRARRAVDRPPPARQPSADRDADPPARPGQHRDRRRARRGHHRGGRPRGRHRPGRGGARRLHRPLRHLQAAAQEQGVAHRAVPVGQAVDPGARAAARAQPASGSPSRAPASTTWPASTSTFPLGVLRRRHRRVRVRASRRSSTTSCCAR